MLNIQNLKYKFNTLDLFGKIIVINITVFVVDILLQVLLKINLRKYFVLPSDLGDFMFQPWSIITYSFFHSGLWHLILNMLMLFYLARIVTNLFRIKMGVNIYLLGVICGGIIYLIVANVTPSMLFKGHSILLGASAGVSALLLFIAVYIPESSIRLFGVFNVTWKQIAIFFVCLDTLRIVLGVNSGGYLAHMGGYLLGFYYARQLGRGSDIGIGFEHFIDSVVNWFKPKTTLNTVHRKPRKPKKTKTHLTDRQKQIDIILDKISKSGYDSLTKTEKEFLFKVGND